MFRVVWKEVDLSASMCQSKTEVPGGIWSFISCMTLDEVHSWPAIRCHSTFTTNKCETALITTSVQLATTSRVVQKLMTKAITIHTNCFIGSSHSYILLANLCSPWFYEKIINWEHIGIGWIYFLFPTYKKKWVITLVVAKIITFSWRLEWDGFSSSHLWRNQFEHV